MLPNRKRYNQLLRIGKKDISLMRGIFVFLSILSAFTYIVPLVKGNVFALQPYLEYQGRLSDQNGNLLTGNYYVTFCMYASSSPVTNCTPVSSPAAAPTISASGTGGTIPTGTYYARFTWKNTNGETVSSTDSSSVSVTLGQDIVVTLPAGANGVFPTGITSADIYRDCARERIFKRKCCDFIILYER